MAPYVPTGNPPGRPPKKRRSQVVKTVQDLIRQQAKKQLGISKSTGQNVSQEEIAKRNEAASDKPCLQHQTTEEAGKSLRRPEVDHTEKSYPNLEEGPSEHHTDDTEAKGMKAEPQETTQCAASLPVTGSSGAQAGYPANEQDNPQDAGDLKSYHVSPPPSLQVSEPNSQRYVEQPCGTPPQGAQGVTPGQGASHTPLGSPPPQSPQLRQFVGVFVPLIPMKCKKTSRSSSSLLPSSTRPGATTTRLFTARDTPTPTSKVVKTKKRGPGHPQKY